MIDKKTSLIVGLKANLKQHRPKRNLIRHLIVEKIKIEFIPFIKNRVHAKCALHTAKSYYQCKANVRVGNTSSKSMIFGPLGIKYSPLDDEPLDEELYF